MVMYSYNNYGVVSAKPLITGKLQKYFTLWTAVLRFHAKSDIGLCETETSHSTPMGPPKKTLIIMMNLNTFLTKEIMGVTEHQQLVSHARP